MLRRVRVLRWAAFAFVAVVVVLYSVVFERNGTPTASATEVAYADGVFTDDNGGVHEAAIEAVAAEGIVKGCAEDRFCPNEHLTRGQFAVMLDRAFKFKTTARDYFTDDNGTYNDAVNKLAAAGIVRGCTASRYCPASPITRGQVATMLAKVLKLPATKKDYFTDDNGSVHESSINKLAEDGVVKGCAPKRFCHLKLLTRAQGASMLARALDIPLKQLPKISWQLDLVMDGIVGGTTDLQAPTGDDRLFLVLRTGTIRIISDKAFLDTPFLDITNQVTSTSSEQGLLGLAFHPDYASNGRFFVFFTDTQGHSQVYEYKVDSRNPNIANTATARKIITFEQRKASNTHKAGQLQFGDDGYLYIAVGDGGGSGDPFRHGQNRNSLLGTIVRIDVDNDDSDEPYAVPVDNPFVADASETTSGSETISGAPEVWAYGLRNPWRFSFDKGYIYIGDVGHVTWEEVNVADASIGGINYGWNIMEGAACYRKGCNVEGLHIPQVHYPRSDGVSVIGGYVYRGKLVPEMNGRYFYADFVGGWIRTFKFNSESGEAGEAGETGETGEVQEHYDWSRVVESPRYVWSFGVDGHGELYVLGRWSVWKVVPS